MSRYIRTMRKIIVFMSLIGMLGSVFPALGLNKVKAATESYLLSQDRPVYVSSTNGGVSGPKVVDGDLTTRWESEFKKNSQWLYVDLGASASITRVEIIWQSAYAKSFQIEVSDDEYTWTPIYLGTKTNAESTRVDVAGTGRFVRLFLKERALTNYGISVFEFQVFGTGGANSPPKPPVANIALNKPAVSSSEETGAQLQPKDKETRNVTDGNRATRWSSLHSDPQWVYIDLGSSQQIGKVNLQWQTAFGRAYDIQVSNDAENWKTVYRQLHGSGGTEEIALYAEGRYVRMYGIGRGTGYGYSLFEMEVYPYQTGDAQPVHDIPPIPPVETVNVGKGSYEINDITQLEAIYPKNKTSNIRTPIPSNDWWQNLLVSHLGNSTGIITLPLKSKYTINGLGLLNPGAGYANGNGGAVNADGETDLYVMANNMTNTTNIETKVDGYGDYSVNVIMSDDASPKMKTTFIKGSPYVYNTFADPNSPEIYSLVTTKIFDDNNNSILAADGSSITADHIGIEVTNVDKAAKPHTFVRAYGIFAPPGTVFTKAGNKIKMKLGGGQNYLSIAAMPSNADLNYYYQHGYAFVTDTKVSYNYDVSKATITTDFNSITESKRTGFSADTLMALLPHQWKVSNSSTTLRTYPSIRGLMKVHEGNAFTTVDKFNGIIPQFVEPDGSAYSQTAIQTYLEYLDTSLSNTAGLMNQDPYWQGKVLHPAAMGAIIADQIGDYTRRDKYLSVLRTVLTDWYTYTPSDKLHTFYLHYSPQWGSIFPWAAGWGINTGLTDHHYTYGYFVYASAVLASFDKGFLNDYGGMVENLIRDYGNPSRTDEMYPWFRSFDPYEGHSWAGGYGDNNSGNNQEAAGESLDGWAGEYLWGIVTGNNSYRDAAAWGFTTELKAIEQYWFNYDQDNFIPEYAHGVAGQVWGSAYLYGTYFSGDPNNIYGIHWLPTAEWMSYFGKDKQKAADLYAAFLKDKGGPEDGWQHIIWPFQSLSDPQAVINKWNPTVMQKNEVFNTYWFIQNTASYGNRTLDIWADNWSSVGIYKKGTQYTAQIWNPTDAPITVQFRNNTGITGSATVAANSLVKVNPMRDDRGDIEPPAAPTNLTAAPGSDSQINLSWTASTDNLGVTGYDIYRNGTKVGSSRTTSFSDTGLSEMTTYSYSVKSKDVAGNISADSNIASAKTKAIPRPLDRTGWTAISSPASGTPTANMLDGSLSTRWTSGKAMAPGQFFQIDMKGARSFNRIVMDANGSNDYVRGYEVYASNDGTNWGTAVASGTGSTAKIAVEFPVKNARYLKVVQTGTATNWWSVSEFNVYTEGDKGDAGIPDLELPAAPGGLTATAVSSSQINLSWTASTDNIGITLYDIYRDGTKIGSSDSTTYNDTGLNLSTTYRYTVKAKDAAGNISAESNPFSAQTQAGSQQLDRTGWTATSSPVSGTPAANMLDGSLSTRWTSGKAMAPGQFLQIDMKDARSFNRIVIDANGSNDYVRGYEVYTSNDGTNWGNAVASGTGSTAKITVEFPVKNARYLKVVQTGTATNWWSVSELNVYSEGDKGETGDAGIPDLELPAAPAGLTATVVSSSQINLSWTASTNKLGVIGYDIYRDGKKVGSSASTTYNDIGLSLSTTYRYTIKAKDAAGNISAESNPFSAQTKALSQQLDRTGWTATSSPVSGNPAANMLDGNLTTRWTSGKAMAPGYAFQVDMNAAKSFNRIVMDSYSGKNDYARGYEVYVSSDGTNWGTAVASGTGSAAEIAIDFPRQNARYLKVVQTGTASSWWTVAELNVFSSDESDTVSPDLEPPRTPAGLTTAAVSGS